LKYKLVIFDLDGTLSDSFPWFLRVMNSVADKHGFRRIQEDDVERMRGMNSREIIEHLRVPAWKVPAIARSMRALKRAHLDQVPLFRGVDRLLQRLAGSGIIIAVVTSDNEANARRILGPGNAQRVTHFECGASLFGKAAKFKRVLRRSGIPADQALCIGDEVRDLEAARSASIAFGAVAWGYASPAALQARGPEEMFFRMDEIADRLAA
jgi:phosphoglycolate phosphatase